MSDNQSAELTIYWKNDNPPQILKQVLKSFDKVNIDIMSEFDLNMKKIKLTVCLLIQTNSFELHLVSFFCLF